MAVFSGQLLNYKPKANYGSNDKNEKQLLLQPYIGMNRPGASALVAQAQAQDADSAAQRTFSEMKGATGKKNEYTAWDHFHFKVVLPIVGFFGGLSSADKTQKALYDTTCKVKGAFETYVKRYADLAQQYKKQEARGAQARNRLAEQKYWESKPLDGIEELQGFINLIERDDKIRAARFEMLEGSQAWKTVVDDYIKDNYDVDDNAENREEATNLYKKAFTGLLAEVGDSQEVLKTLRRSFAQECLKRAGDIKTFIDKFEDYVATGVELELGEELEVRDTFLNAIASHVNNTGDAARKEVLDYLTEAVEPQKRYGVKEVGVQKYFQDALQSLVNGNEPITVEVLEELKYEKNGLNQRPIRLGVFVEDLGNLAESLEGVRLNAVEFKAAKKQYHIQEGILSQEYGTFELLQSNMVIQDRVFSAQELIDGFFGSITPENLKDILGQELFDSLNEINCEADEFQINIANTKKIMQESETKWAEFEQKHATAGGKIKGKEAQLRHEHIYRTAQLEFLNNKELLTFRLSKVEHDLSELQGIAALGLKFVLSDNQLLQLKESNVLLPLGGNLSIAIMKAMKNQENMKDQKAVLDKAQDVLLKEAGPAGGKAHLKLVDTLKLAKLFPRNGAAVNKEGEVVLSVDTLVPRAQANELDRLHHLSLDRGRLFAAADIVIRVEGQYRQSGYEAAVAEKNVDLFGANDILENQKVVRAQGAKTEALKKFKLDEEEALQAIFPSVYFNPQAELQAVQPIVVAANFAIPLVTGNVNNLIDDEFEDMSDEFEDMLDGLAKEVDNLQEHVSKFNEDEEYIRIDRGGILSTGGKVDKNILNQDEDPDYDSVDEAVTNKNKKPQRKAEFFDH